MAEDSIDGKVEKTSRKDSIELARDLLQKYGLQLDEGKGLKPYKMNGPTGIALCNHSGLQAIYYCAQLTGCD
jgi:hypothetical protein